MIEVFEHFLEPTDMALGLLEVVFEGSLKIWRVCGFSSAIFGSALTNCFSAS
jgi:hypothetical protein